MCRDEGAARMEMVSDPVSDHRAAEVRVEHVAEERECENEHEHRGHDEGAEAHHER